MKKFLMRFAVITCCAIVVSLPACSSISEWGYKMPTGTERFAAVPSEHVEVLFAAPTHPFKQIGIVSVVGSVTSSDVAIYKKLRKAAADLGADAVVVPDKADGFWKRNLGTAIKYAN